MKTIATFTFMVLGLSVFSQESLNTFTDFLPNQTDSNIFYYHARLGYLLPFKETTSFQKVSLGPGFNEGNRLFSGSIEMIIFTSFKEEKELLPHFLYRIDFFPNQYLSSRFGFGTSSRKFSSSFGVFAGQYFRRVPYEANFTTRRKRTFEHHPLAGFYLQSSSEHASFVSSFAFERSKTFHSVRVAGHLGHTFKAKGLLSDFRAVLLSESYTGTGVGFGLLSGGTIVEILFVVPDKREQEIEARLRNKLTRGFLINLSHTIR